MNRTFLLGLVATGVGLIAGIGYRVYLGVSGTCGGLFGTEARASACTTTESWTAFLNVFSLVTLVLAIVFGLVSTRVNAEHEGFVSVGDSFLAIGTIVSLVEVVIFASFGAYLGIAYGVAAVALTLFALKQDRHAATGVACLMSLFVAVWIAADPSAFLLGITPAVLWVLAALAYVSSIKVGEMLATD